MMSALTESHREEDKMRRGHWTLKAPDKRLVGKMLRCKQMLIFVQEESWIRGQRSPEGRAKGVD